MALYKKLDLWSISDGLDKMMDYCYNGNEKNSPYWDHYCEQSMNYAMRQPTCIMNFRM